MRLRSEKQPNLPSFQQKTTTFTSFTMSLTLISSPRTGPQSRRLRRTHPSLRQFHTTSARPQACTTIRLSSSSISQSTLRSSSSTQSTLHNSISGSMTCPTRPCATLSSISGCLKTRLCSTRSCRLQPSHRAITKT